MIIPGGEIYAARIVNLQERQRQKQIKYERKMLRELSLENMKGRFQQYFGEDHIEIVEDGYIDVAIRTLLLGASIVSLAIMASHNRMMQGCAAFKKKNDMIDTLFNFILYWGEMQKPVIHMKKGFTTAVRGM